MLKTIQDKARHRTRPLWAWLKLLWQRIDEDNMTTLAGNLAGNDSNLLIVFYVQIMPDDFVMQLHRF